MITGKVLLVDDERIICESLRNSVDWAALSLEVVGEAQDSANALAIIKKLRPDIVITDIKMPYMDGLNLTELIRMEYPGVHVILLSGFDEFQYAQRGIELGVSGYFLKPIDNEKFLSLLKKLSGKIAQERKNGEDDPATQDPGIRTIIQDKFFRSIIYKTQDCAEILRLQKSLLGADSCNFSCAILQMDGYFALICNMSEEEQVALSRQFFDSMDRYCSVLQNVSAIAAENHEYVLCFYEANYNKLNKIINQVCTQIKQVMKNNGISVSIGIGKICENAYKLKDSYYQARKAIKLKFTMGVNSVIYYSNVEGMESEYDADFVKVCDGIMSAVRCGSQEQLMCRLEKVTLDIMVQGEMSKPYMTLLVSSLFYQTIDYFESLGACIEEVYEDPIEVFSTLLQHQTVSELSKALYEMLCNVIEYVNIRRQGRFCDYIEKAKTFIAQHFTEDDISLDRIAEEIHMSVSYFSVEFKRVVGKTYIEYLTEMRLNRAKELLVSMNYRISEVSKMVGYENPTYFNYIFKQNTGLTPSQFRKQQIQTRDFCFGGFMRNTSCGNNDIAFVTSNEA